MNLFVVSLLQIDIGEKNDSKNERQWRSSKEGESEEFAQLFISVSNSAVQLEITFENFWLILRPQLNLSIIMCNVKVERKSRS